MLAMVHIVYIYIFAFYLHFCETNLSTFRVVLFITEPVACRTAALWSLIHHTSTAAPFTE